jgi:hypothetical protein
MKIIEDAIVYLHDGIISEDSFFWHTPEILDYIILN